MERPRVGMGVIILREGRVLLGRRKASHGTGTWCPPGGHLEFGEDLEECARREVLEETGVSIRNIRFAAATNDFFKEEGKHYITLFMLAEWESGEPVAMEPEKSELWRWFGWNELPRPLFLPVQNLLKQGFRPERLLTRKA
jgi:8-oxo-dGTP diphosphatase